MNILDSQSTSLGDVVRKLPHVTLLFWIVKIIAVTLGETAGDLFGITFKLGYIASASIFLVFLIAVGVSQVCAKRFHPWLYWSVILGTSLAGTEISDFMNRGFGHSGEQNGIGYAGGAALLITILLAVFLIWWRTGQSFDVENIATRRAEILYWIAIVVSNTLGTSTGDWLSDDTGLGFGHAFAILAVVMLVIVAAHYLTPISTPLLFWLAFILTRPLGAAGGDALTKPRADGGLGWGTVGGSTALLVALILLVAWQTYRVQTRTPRL